MSWHHGMVEANYNRMVTVGEGRDLFSIVTAPNSDIPVWVGAIPRAYQRKIDEIILAHKGQEEPPHINEWLKALTWRRDLFTAHSIPSSSAINEQSPHWDKMRDLAAYAFYKHVNFQPSGLSEQDARERDTREALVRMHEPVLILP